MGGYEIYAFYSFNGICGDVYDRHGFEAHASDAMDRVIMHISKSDYRMI